MCDERKMWEQLKLFLNILVVFHTQFLSEKRSFDSNWEGEIEILIYATIESMRACLMSPVTLSGCWSLRRKIDSITEISVAVVSCPTKETQSFTTIPPKNTKIYSISNNKKSDSQKV